MQNIATQVSVTISSGTFSLELRAMFWEAILWLVKMIIILTRDPSVSFNLIFRQPETTVCLFSYAGFRKTQARVRMFSLATLATIVAIAVLSSLITNLIFGGKAPTWAASFGWTQDDWSSGEAIDRANHSTNRLADRYFKYFASSSLVRILTNGTLSLATTTTSTTTTNFSNNTGSNMYLLNGFPTQKKLDNARCATTTECSNGACTEDFNNIAQKYCHTDSNKCIDWISNSSSSEYTNSFIHCSANSYSKSCNNGTWGATTTPTLASVCTPTSGANNGLANGGWRASSTTCNEGSGFPTIACASCNTGYVATLANNGCYANCATNDNTKCIINYHCYNTDSTCRSNALGNLCDESSDCNNSFCSSGTCQVPPACYGNEIAGSFCLFNGLTYGVVSAANGRLWLDRNLGAERVPVSADDPQGYGWYYQWGRASDGHQLASSTVTAVRSSSRNPGHSSFITTGSDIDWTSSLVYNTWNGVSAINNPCPPGYRLPSITEWSALGYSWSNAYDSPLKLPRAGWRYFNGGLSGQGDAMQYSAGTGDASGMDKMYKVSNWEEFQHTPLYADGYSVRCIKN